VLGGENAAFQVDRHAAIERLFREGKQFGIAAGKTDADIVVQNVNASPAGNRILDHRLDFSVFRDVGLEGRRRAAFDRDHVYRLLRRAEIVVDAQHLCSFACEGEGGGPAIAHAFAWTLPGADDDGDAIFEAHSFHSGMGYLCSTSL
jgi:hypothetical protein